MSIPMRTGLFLPIFSLATAALALAGAPAGAQESADEAAAAAQEPAGPPGGDAGPGGGSAAPPVEDAEPQVQDAGPPVGDAEPPVQDAGPPVGDAELVDETAESTDQAKAPPDDTAEPANKAVSDSRNPGGLAEDKPDAPAKQEAPGQGVTVTATHLGTPAESGTDADAPPAFGEETQEEELQRYFELYKAAMENDAYVEADALAKQVVELSIRLFGIDSLDSARALTNLGIAQHQNEQYEAAIANYGAAIDIIERTEDRLNAHLVNPLKGLGAAQLASGRPDLASETFQRAVHITHVNEGPHNLDQVEVLESLAETYLAVGKFDQVEILTEIIFGLEARDKDLESMAILPVLEKQAYWQHRLQLFDKERYTWRKVIDIIEDNAGNDDLRLIPPLTGLGKSYLYIGSAETTYYQPAAVTSGEVYLKRAVRIAEDNPEATWEMQEDALLSLGDFYILSGQASRARRVYKETWDLLSADEERLGNRHEHLEKLVVLQEIHPPKYVGIDGEVRAQLPGDDYEEGKVVFDYSVTTRGFTNDVVLVEAEPAAFENMQRTVQNDLRTLIYRPRLAEGETVDTSGLTYTHKFFYRRSDLEKIEQEGATAAAAD